MASMINSYSVGLSLDAKGMIQGGKLARSEMASLSRVMREVQTPTEKLTRDLNLVEKAMRTGAGDADKLAQAQSRLKTRIEETNAAVQKQAGLMPKLSQGMAVAGSAGFNVGGMVPGLAIAGSPNMIAAGVAGGIIVQAARLHMEQERNNAKFRTMLGSKLAGENMNRELTMLAGTTPLNTGGVQSAATTLLAFGVAGEKIIPTLRMLGDVTAADNERFKSMALAFGQMSAAGRMMGQDLLQMINAGFNPLQEISMMTGETMIELKKRMEDGAVSAHEVEAAFRHATEAGGRFHGLMNEMADTSAGKLEIALSKLTDAGRELGNTLAPLIEQTATGASEGAGGIQMVAEGLGFAAAFTRDRLSSNFSLDHTSAYLDQYKQRQDLQAWQEKYGAIAEARKSEMAKQAEEDARRQAEIQRQQAARDKIHQDALMAARESDRKRREEAMQRQQDEERRLMREKEQAEREQLRHREAAHRMAQKELQEQEAARKRALEDEKRKRETYKSEALTSVDANSADAYRRLVEFQQRKVDASKGNVAERQMIDLQRDHLEVARRQDRTFERIERKLPQISGV